jgi:hypothetical protein
MTILEFIGFDRDMERFAGIARVSITTPPVGTPNPLSSMRSNAGCAKLRRD